MIKKRRKFRIEQVGKGQNDCIFPKTQKMDNVNVIIEDTPAEIALSKVANSYNLVGVARTFNEALQLFYANKVDVVIIDIFLNGSQVIAFADDQCDPNHAICVLTSSNDRQIFERAKLTRPFSFL
jgi:response regulator of citrate/malate metabolism